ncbi:MAG: hypothetical protein WCF07_14210 [Nitrososphaeraceae archaeon]
MQWKSLARHSIRHLIELGTSNANTPAGSEETIGVGARVRLIHSDDPYTKLEPGDEDVSFIFEDALKKASLPSATAGLC